MLGLRDEVLVLLVLLERVTGAPELLVWYDGVSSVVVKRGWVHYTWWKCLLVVVRADLWWR